MRQGNWPPLEICFVNDIVVVKHTVGVVAANCHGHLFRNSSPGHISEEHMETVVKPVPMGSEAICYKCGAPVPLEASLDLGQNERGKLMPKNPGVVLTEMGRERSIFIMHGVSCEAGEFCYIGIIPI